MKLYPCNVYRHFLNLLFWNPVQVLHWPLKASSLCGKVWIQRRADEMSVKVTRGQPVASVAGKNPYICCFQRDIRTFAKGPDVKRGRLCCTSVQIDMDLCPFFFFSLLFRIQPTTCAAEGSSQCCMMECESGYLALWRVIIIEHSGYSSDTWATFWPAICSKLLPNTTESLHMTDRQRLWLQWFICKTTQYLLMRSSFKSINRFWCFFSWRSVDLAPSFLKDWRCHDSFCRKPRSGVALRSGLFLWYPDVEWPLWQGENIFCYVKYLEEPSQVKVGCKGTWTLLQPTQGNNSSMLPQKGGYTTQVQRLLQLLPVQMSLLAVWFHSDGGTEEQLLWITSTSALK